MVVMETTDQVMQALENKYQAPIYAFLRNVGNATGGRCHHYADAIAMCLWASRGLNLIGFEVKVSRGDWLKEFKKPSKAEAIADYCDEWYLVIGDESILRFGELPADWGLMVPHTKTELKIVRESKRNVKPKPVDKFIMAAILRRATEQLLPESQKMQEYQRGLKDGEESEKRHKCNELDWGQKRSERLQKVIADFELASGVDINSSWNSAEKIGDAAKSVLDGSYLKELESLKGLRRHAQNCLSSIDEEIKKLEKQQK